MLGILCIVADAETLSNQFIEQYKDQESFVQYYISNWHGRIQKWSKDFRNFRHNNQDTNGAIERWHRTFKSHLSAERNWKTGRRVSWLLHILTDDIEALYWCLAQLKVQGRMCNRIKGKYALTAIENARSIPDNMVTIEQLDERNCGFVRSVSNPDKVHEIVGFDTDTAACTCPQGTQGNICKHQIKCLLLQGHTETSLQRRLGSSMGTISGGLTELSEEPSDPAEVSCSEGDTEDEQEGDTDDDTEEFTNCTEDFPVLDSGVLDSGEHSFPEPHDVTTSTAIVENPTARKKKMTREDAVQLVNEMFQSVGTDEHIIDHITVLLTDASEVVKKLIARRTFVETICVEPFASLPDSDNMLRRKPDFLERFIGSSSNRNEARKRPNDSSADTAIPEFTRKLQPRESIQQSLDTRALISLDLNALPIDYSSLAPARGVSKRRK
ncbi:hypothetical protein R1sor_010794 [Riccia sorocarpa]|uniref:SWIM-type domain-containing protein n=1 Tax=Riccia sorocarpa TaxID=122646 RepID=A0ABD3HZ27_9MARC